MAIPDQPQAPTLPVKWWCHDTPAVQTTNIPFVSTVFVIAPYIDCINILSVCRKQNTKVSPQEHYGLSVLCDIS